MSQPDAERQIALFNDSLERCMARPEFLDRFYELFLASSPEVAEKFRHTDFTKQKRALRASLFIMMLSREWQSEASVHLERIAELHSHRQLDIRPHLYDLWLECLIQAVRQTDPHFDDQIEQAWRQFMKQGIALMKSRY